MKVEKQGTMELTDQLSLIERADFPDMWECLFSGGMSYNSAPRPHCLEELKEALRKLAQKP